MQWVCWNCGTSIELADEPAPQPGPCPRCGQFLRPVSVPQDDAGKDPKQRQITLLAVALFLLLILFLFSLLFAPAGGGMGWGKGTVWGNRLFGSSGTGTGDKKSDRGGESGPAPSASEGQRASEKPGGAPEPGPKPDAGSLALTRPDMTNSLPAAGVPDPDIERGARIASPTFAGVQGRGTRFVYVIDRSSSMMGPRFQAAQAELLRSMQGLQTNMAFMIIFYNSQMTPMPGGWLPATRTDLTRAATWVRNIRPDGGTNPEESMLAALRMRPDTIWLLSDGEFDSSVVDSIRLANPGGKTMINTIAFQDSSGEALLKRIAAENSGTYRFVAP